MSALRTSVLAFADELDDHERDGTHLRLDEIAHMLRLLVEETAQ